MSILVTAATGQLGALVLRELLQKTAPEKIHVAVRTISKLPSDIPKEVHRHQADYNDIESLKAAMVGIEKVLLISSDAIGNRLSQHKKVIDAAKSANIKLLVYTSILHADVSPLKMAGEHKATEVYIKASGIPYVFLRNGWYTENYTMSYGAWLSHGAIVGASQNGKVSAAARSDYALAAAIVLTESGHENKAYELAGDVAFSGEELAKEVTEQSGKNIVWSSIPESDYAKMLLGFGLPAPAADVLADADSQAATGALEDNSGTLSKLIGRKTVSLKDSIKACKQT